VLRAHAAYENLSASGDYVERDDARAPTRFERRGERLGHVVHDLAFRRI
jgi:tRNA (guanine-N7-)-methyltransferase